MEANITTVMRTIHHRWISTQGALEWRLPAYPVVKGKHPVASNLGLLTDTLRDSRPRADPLVTDVIAPSELEHTYEAIRMEPERHLGVVLEWAAGASLEHPVGG